MVDEMIILKYFDGNANSKEVALVEEWKLNNSNDFEIMRDLWEESVHTNTIVLENSNSAWDDFLDKKDAGPTPSEEAPVAKSNIWKIIGIIAALIALGVLIFYLFQNNRSKIIYASTDQESKTIVLPDQSKVLLSDHSTLSYPNTFDGADKRVVQLEGKGKFDIESNPDVPFVVQTNDIGVKVLGTIFTVDVHEGETVVENIEGLIRMFILENEDEYIDIKEGESVNFDGTSLALNSPPVEIKEPEKEEIIDKEKPKEEAQQIEEVPQDSTSAEPEKEVKVESISLGQVLFHLKQITSPKTDISVDNESLTLEVPISLDETDPEKFIAQIKEVANIDIEPIKFCKGCYRVNSISPK